jgi:hypothetical protein
MVAAIGATLGAAATAVIACVPDFTFAGGGGSTEGGPPSEAGPDVTIGDGAPNNALRRVPGDLMVAGYGFACAKQNGVVTCWGDSQADHLSRYGVDGATPLPPAPAQWPDGGAVRDSVHLAAAHYHACLLAADRRVYCWGFGTDGRLGYRLSSGIGAPLGPAVRTIQTAVEDVQQLVAGGNFTCALTRADLLCWGDNTYAQQTSEVGATSTAATRIPQLGGKLEAVALGFEHGCGITTERTVVCWGRNDFRQAGAPTGETCASSPAVPCVKKPQVIAGVNDPRQLALGTAHSCALQGDGKVVCWGSAAAGAIGVLDAGSTCFRPTEPDAGLPCTERPQHVTDLGVPTQIAAGGPVTCALVGGRAHCWGYNGDGQLGHGDRDPWVSDKPLDVLYDTNTPLEGIREVQLTDGCGCALTAEAGAFCWGTSYGGIFLDAGDNSNGYYAHHIRF